MKGKINLIEWIRGQKALCINDYGDIEIDAEFIQKNAKKRLINDRDGEKDRKRDSNI